MTRALSFNEAKVKAARFCAFKERSPKEVEDKLKIWGLSSKEIAELSDILMKERFVDPERFASAFCHDKFEFNSWGKNKIRAQIAEHRISSDLIDKALDRIDSQVYLERLFMLSRKKWDSINSQDVLMRKQKTFNFLAGKGYEPDLIWRSINWLIDQ